MANKDIVFALDIGTRTVVGVVIERQGSGMAVRAAGMVEHETRAMYEGQIHDVAAVAGAISRVKAQLEEELGVPLNRAAVAAAGRALRTAGARVDKQIELSHEFSREEIHALELEAVQKAQQEIITRAEAEEIATTEYFCVGYSIVNYYLEGQLIGSLVGQVGTQIAVEVIATFLPRVVVDSLLSSLRQAGLEAQSLTLEPIAAMTVAIPPRMRLLNLALVDIGAGTSDIAIVKNGSIIAYAMVPVGGDEVTEKLAEKYLLDFNTAEAVKCQLSQGEQVTFQDILGNPFEVSTAEVADAISEVVRDIAVRIAREVLVLNQKACDAVICVGGGSLTPGLLGELAGAMELARNRVGMRTREAITEVKGDFPPIQGPLGVTPMGIGFNALQQPSLPLMRVRVNQRELPLWSLNKTTVATALLSAGISLNDLYGKPGMGKTIRINGSLKVIKGGLGQAPSLKVDGEPAQLDTEIHEGAVIEFIKGVYGENAECKVGEVIPRITGEVWVNGNRIEIVPQIIMNGQLVEGDEPVPDRAEIQYARQNSLASILLAAGVRPELLQERVFHYHLNGEPGVFTWVPVEARIGGQAIELDYPVMFGSRVEYRLRPEAPPIKAILPSPEDMSLRVKVNGQELLLPYKKYSLRMNNRPVGPEDILVSQADISITETNQGAILSDILGYIDILPRTTGQLVMKVNGEKAGFTTPIDEECEVEIYWQGEEPTSPCGDSSPCHHNNGATT